MATTEEIIDSYRNLRQNGLSLGNTFYAIDQAFGLQEGVAESVLMKRAKAKPPGMWASMKAGLFGHHASQTDGLDPYVAKKLQEEEWEQFVENHIAEQLDRAFGVGL